MSVTTATSVTRDDDNTASFRVKKRNGSFQLVDPDKLRKVIARCSHNLVEVDDENLLHKTLNGMFDGITTQEIYDLLIQNSSMLIGNDPSYSKLASRFLHAKIKDEVKGLGVNNFANSVAHGYDKGIISEKTYEFVMLHKDTLNKIPRDKDLFEYFGLRTVYDRYLLKDPVSRKVFEAPQYFYLRVACGLAETVEEAKELYDLISSFDYHPSTPTLFNSGTRRSQMSSCYLLDSPEDSLESIYDKYKDVALLSKFAGGIGLAYHRVRSQGSLIRGTNGKSNGIIPFLKTLDSSVSAVNQGGKRKGAACVYLETWHADILDFLQLRENTGDESRRTHNLNTANWIPDIFMRRVVDNEVWSLFDPADVPDFPDLYGEDFDKAYEQAEAESKFVQQIPAREIYGAMMKSLAQTGNGWMTWKDACNRKANQVGKDPDNAIHLSNLCFSGDTVVAVADGRNGVSIKELAEESEGKVRFPVYSARPNKKGFKRWKTEIKWAVAFKTGRQKVLEITLSNGDTFKCTGDHELALQGSRDYVLAKDSLNAELEPFFSYTSKYGSPYRHINAITDGHSKQHLLIFDFYTKGNRNFIDYPHHIDHIDSSAEVYDSILNLQVLNQSDHYKKTAGEMTGTSNAVHRLRDRKTYVRNKQISMGGKGNSRFSGIDNFKLIEMGKKCFDQYGTIDHHTYECILVPQGAPKSFSKYRFGGGAKGWALYLDYVKGIKEYNGEYDHKESLVVYHDVDADRLAYLYNHFYTQKASKKIQNKGLRVVGIKECDEEEDVYDLTVEDNHNFYILTSADDEKYQNSQGVLVHNCTEIVEITSEKETAVCNLGSINLRNYVAKGKVDYNKLAANAQKAIKYLDRVIDINFYPIGTAKDSNARWRPVGLGIMGLQDMFFQLGLPYDSKEAQEISTKVQEEIYYNAILASVEIAEKEGPHQDFELTRASDGFLQFDLWGVKPTKPEWAALKERVAKVGLRNSLLIAIAPTATIASIVGSYECQEAMMSNLFKRETLSGEFIQINNYLVTKLKELGLWTKSVKDKIKLADGSIQNIGEIPEDIRKLFRTVWELPQKSLIEMAAARGAYIDQSQSLNLFIENPTIGKLSSMYKHAWKKGLKTTYYLRSRSATKIKKTTVGNYKPLEAVACSLENPETCEACE